MTSMLSVILLCMLSLMASALARPVTVTADAQAAGLASAGTGHDSVQAGHDLSTGGRRLNHYGGYYGGFAPTPAYPYYYYGPAPGPGGYYYPAYGPFSYYYPTAAPAPGPAAGLKLFGK